MRLMLSLTCCALIVSPLHAQKVVIDFATKKLTESPPKINTKTTATIEVQNVNDILYRYSIVVTQTPRVHDDFSSISGAFKNIAGAGEGAPDPDCPPLAQAVADKSKALASAQDKFYSLPVTHDATCSAKKPCSLDIKTTKAEWDTNFQPSIDALKTAVQALDNIQGCHNVYGKEISDANAALANLADTYASLSGTVHVIQQQKDLLPDTDDSVEVTELYFLKGASQGIATTADVVTVKFSPDNDRLTLSAGALFSMIQNRGYTSQAAPNSTGTGTQNVLAVSGISTLSPLAVGLLNYEIPPIGKLSFSNDNWGLAVSTGPVLRFGAKSDTSSFGYFVGMSLQIYHRFYISPGVHFGEYADYPPGFTAPNQPVPSGLGTPTPVKRYIARFSFGITYKVKDFSSLGLNTSATKTPSSTKTSGAAATDSTNQKATNASPPSS